MSNLVWNLKSGDMVPPQGTYSFISASTSYAQFASKTSLDIDSF